SDSLAQRGLASPSEIRQTNSRFLARNSELPRSARLTVAQRSKARFEAQPSNLALATPKIHFYHF
ncbi:hypothetical protein A2U01_0048250, partial [Trifolium medium]|nr:hypothetical protein [Trifolium medium]